LDDAGRQEWVDDRQILDPLTMRQILGKQSLTLSKQRRRNDEAIPNGETVAFDDIQGSRKDCKGILLDRKSLPALINFRAVW